MRMKLLNCFVITSALCQVRILAQVVPPQSNSSLGAKEEDRFVSCGSLDVFTCTSESKCIAKTRKCDGVVDCKGGEDEFRCRSVFEKKECREGHDFECTENHECISKFWRCDGEFDCMDKSDEVGCSPFTSRHLTCKHDQFKCEDGLICITDEWVCNGEAECLDGSDEKNCKTDECPNDKFKCKSTGSCIPRRWVCDGTPECADGSDEGEHCNLTETSCPLKSGKFLCSDKKECIDADKVCNGKVDCHDESDEGEFCSTSQCKDLGCNQNCAPSIDGNPKCFCNSGFKLGNDSKSCSDVDECQTFGTCSQTCVNTDGSYFCSCFSGYGLQKKTNSCKALQNPTYLFYSTQREIRSLEISNEFFRSDSIIKTKDTFHLSNVSQAIGVTFDALEDRIYWSAAMQGKEAIMSAKRDGTEVEIFDQGKYDMPESIAFDYLGRNLYFVESRHKFLGVKNVDSKHSLILLNTTLDKPRAVAVFPEEGYLFVSDWSEHNPRIIRMEMNGDNVMNLVNRDIKWPSGVAVDKPARRVYWSDTYYDQIESVDLEGNNRHKIAPDVIRHPFSIAVFEDTIYWSDWEDMTLLSCNKFTGKNLTWHVNIFGTEPRPMGISLYHSVLESVQPSSSPCHLSVCSHICLLRTKGDFSCHCPEGWTLGNDSTNCLEDLSNKDKLPSVSDILDEEEQMRKEIYDGIWTSLKPVEESTDRPVQGRSMESGDEVDTFSKETKDRKQDNDYLIPNEELFPTPIEPINFTEGPIKKEKVFPSTKEEQQMEYTEQIIIGVVITIILLVILALLVFCCLRRRSNQKAAAISLRFKNPNFRRGRFGSCCTGEELKDVTVDKSGIEEDSSLNELHNPVYSSGLPSSASANNMYWAHAALYNDNDMKLKKSQTTPDFDTSTNKRTYTMESGRSDSVPGSTPTIQSSMEDYDEDDFVNENYGDKEQLIP